MRKSLHQVVVESTSNMERLAKRPRSSDLAGCSERHWWYSEPPDMEVSPGQRSPSTSRPARMPYAHNTHQPPPPTLHPRPLTLPQHTGLTHTVSPPRLVPLKVTLEDLARCCDSRVGLLRGRFASAAPGPAVPPPPASTASLNNSSADRIGHWLCRLAVAAAGGPALSGWWATAETMLFARRLAGLADPAKVASVLSTSSLVSSSSLGIELRKLDVSHLAPVSLSIAVPSSAQHPF